MTRRAIRCSPPPIAGTSRLQEGLPPLVTRYEQAGEGIRLGRLVVDREGMAAAWLAGLTAQGRTVVTILRADQYQGLASFSELGPFVPWRRDRQGRVTREVASACYLLSLPDHPGQQLPLWVALVQDWTQQVPVPTSKADRASPPRWDADLEWKAGWWWDADWVATPSPAAPTEPKLIPIVTTAPIQDAVALAETYTHRWPAQENSLRDWLLAVGLDTNHGYRSTPVENSEVTKRRMALQGGWNGSSVGHNGPASRLTAPVGSIPVAVRKPKRTPITCIAVSPTTSKSCSGKGWTAARYG